MTDTLTEARTFALGDRITYTEGGRDYTGTVCGIFTPETAGVDGAGASYPSLWVFGEYPHNHSIRTAREGFTNDSRTQWDDAVALVDETQGHWVSTRYDAPRLATEETADDHHAAALSESAAQITTLEATVSDLREQVAAAHDVLQRIGGALVETAELHEWCGEFDRRANELADNLPSRYGFADTFRESVTREREYEVCVHWTETVEHSTTVTVTASSESAAVDMVSDSPSDWVESDDRYSVNERSVEWDEIHID